jgi:transposase
MDIVNTVLPKEKNPQGRAPKFSVEYYMMMAKRVVEEGLTFREASKIYNCSHGTVNHWAKLYRSGVLPNRLKKEKRDAATKESDFLRLEHHVKNLKTEIGELYLENLMLKKALEYSRQIKKEDLSVITSENLDQLQKDVE